LRLNREDGRRTSPGSRSADARQPRRRCVNQNGDEVWLNANHIRAFKVHDPSMPSVAFGWLGQVRQAKLN
jgi:hypothetical protein